MQLLRKSREEISVNYRPYSLGQIENSQGGENAFGSTTKITLKNVIKTLSLTKIKENEHHPRTLGMNLAIFFQVIPHSGLIS